MQTPLDIQAKVHEMAQELPDQLYAEVQRLLESGAFALDDASNDFRIPKLVYVQALRTIAEGYAPLPHDKAGIKTLKNLARH